MTIRLNVACLALAGLVLIGCGSRHQTGPAAVARPDQFKLTPPEPIESPQSVPPLPSIAAGASTQGAALSPTAVATTTGSETQAAQPSVPSPAATTTGTEFARFTGRITVDGAFQTLPPLVRMGDSAAKDAPVCAKDGVPNDSVVVTNGGLADVFVYARRVPPGVDVPPPPSDPAVLDQKGCRFHPQAFVLRVHQPLQLVNDDPIAHNIRFSGFTKSFNQTVGAGDRGGVSTTYDSSETVPVQTRCDFHPWMAAWHLPLDHPWGTVSAEDGTFVIDDLPPGNWEFVIWHNKTGYIDKSFKFSAAAGQIIEHDFTVPVADLQ